MMKSMCIPLFVVTHIEYILAAKLIETFSDAAYNFSLKPQITAEFILKKGSVEVKTSQ